MQTGDTAPAYAALQSEFDFAFAARRNAAAELG
jgi:hypothetical protein